ncbi:MAG: HTTM domain-containing protein, partial [Gemmataceae bacterium]
MMTEDEKPESMERSRNVLATGWTRLTGLMGSQVDGASLAVFRIAFGLVLAYYALSYLWPVDGETILSHFFTEAAFLFPYRGFEWVRPWPEPYLTLHMVVIALAGLGVALGFCYRVSAMVLFLSYTYFFLLDEAHYNNHYYLMSLLAFLLIWMPAQQRFSVHAWWRTRVRRDDHATLVPFWPIVVLRAQLFIIYFFGGVAKFDGDWLKGVTMYPIGLKLREALCNFVPVPDLLGGKEFALFLAWTGLIFDLSIGFLLLWRRTRFLALALTAVFHMTNHFLFPIGVFPFLALAATLVFLEPDWPVRVWNWIRKPRLARPELGWLLGGMIAVPVLGAALGWKQRAASNALPGRPLKFATALVLTWIAAHVLIPLRHYAIPGDANWTADGHKFSWRMMRRSKHPAHLVFRVVDEEIKVVRTNGETDIDWQLWPAGQPHVLHVAVNSRSIDWSKMPDLSVLYDTSLGERLIFNPYAKGRSAVSAEEYRQRINKVWLKAFGRHPAILESIDLLEALRLARTNVQQSNFGSPSARAALEKLIEGALKLVPRLHDKE